MSGFVMPFIYDLLPNLGGILNKDFRDFLGLENKILKENLFWKLLKIFIENVCYLKLELNDYFIHFYGNKKINVGKWVKVIGMHFGQQKWL